MKSLIKKNHFIWLTLAMVGMLIAGALTKQIENNRTLELLEFSSIILLFISLLSLNTERKWGKFFLAIIGFMLIVVIFRSVTGIHYFEYSYLGFLLIFYIAAAWIVGENVLLTGEVDLNIVTGSVALYLLIGLIWSILYAILLEFSPNAFNGIEAGPWYDNMSVTTYFSFVTLTTLGYGDISPVKPLSEVLVILEAVVGMFYMAVIVASLIGARRDKSE
jgi:voltage-gated potassium channel